MEDAHAHLVPGVFEMDIPMTVEEGVALSQYGDQIVGFARRDPGNQGPLVVELKDGSVHEVTG